MNLRTFRPRYFLKRLRQELFWRRHPDCPWLGEAAVLFLDAWLKATDVCFEWGSGRSTVWLARRVARLTSVDDDPAWHAKISSLLAGEKLSEKVHLRLIGCDCGEQDEPPSHPYADAILEVPDESLDFVLVDGNIRLLCMQRAMPKLRPGGPLALDNANRYVPNTHLGGYSTIHEPRSRPRSAGWAALLGELRGWRCILTTDGIWDTRFWVKPP